MVSTDIIAARASGMGLTFAALERKADIANGSIARWKESSPNLETIKKVADVLGCTVDDLMIKDRR